MFKQYLKFSELCGYVVFYFIPFSLFLFISLPMSSTVTCKSPPKNNTEHVYKIQKITSAPMDLLNKFDVCQDENGT